MPSDNAKHPLAERFRASILADASFQAKARLAVAVSGRCDSVALLHLLHQVAPVLKLQLTVVHVQPGDDPEGVADAESVRALAQGLALPLEIIKDDQPTETPEARAAALARSLAAAPQQLRVHAIATGETLDDVAEIFLTDLIAGSAGGPLPPPRADGWVQPLLTFTHEECLAFLRVERIPFRHDPAALELTTTRQKLRLLVLPLLTRHIQREASARLASTARALAEDTAFLSDLAWLVRTEVGWTETRNEVTVDAARLQGLPVSLRRRILADAAATVNAAPLALTTLSDLERHIRTMADAAKVTTDTLKVSRTDGTLTVTKPAAP